MKVHGSNVQVGGGKGVMIEGNTFAGLNQDVTHNDAPTHANWEAARERRDAAASECLWYLRANMLDEARAAVRRHDDAEYDMKRIAAVLDARD